MVTPAVSPYISSYATATPYITEAEFLAAPTALEVTDLIPGGSQAQQDQAITDTIARASGWMDDLCRQVLAATVDIEQGRYRVDRFGYVRVPLKYKPVLAINSISLGTKQSSMVALTDLSDVEVSKTSIRVPVFSLNTPQASQLNGGWSVGSDILVAVSYINGWVNTLLAASVVQGATSMTVQSALGIYPGTALRISDGPNSEVVTVAQTYTIGSTTVPLVTGFAHAHTAGTTPATTLSVSNLPLQAKEAAILLTTALIQTRGNDAIILESMENPTRLSNSYGSLGASVEMAKAMLETLIRVW